MAVPDSLGGRLALPIVAAPMTAVSGPELVVAACRDGVIGAFPTHNAPSVSGLDDWLGQIFSTLGGEGAPVAANLVVHRSNTRLEADVNVLVQRRVPLVITSVGQPDAVLEPLHGAGCLVFADVASLRHAQRAIESGVDGLVLLTAGAGGQTGTANPFAFVRAVRERFEGPVVLAGGIADGAAVHAALTLGADLAYMGTRFIATTESLAGDDYRAALVASTMDDVQLSTRVGGIPASLLRSWLERYADENDSSDGFQQERLLRNRTAWSAGHGVTSVRAVTSAAELIESLKREYDEARSRATAARSFAGA